MNRQKIFTYVALVLGVVGLISQVMILSQGDDAIKLNASAGSIDIDSADNITVDAADTITLTTADTGADGKISLNV